MQKLLQIYLLTALILLSTFETSKAAPYISPQAQKHFPNCAVWLTDFSEKQLDISADQIISVGLFSELATLLDKALRLHKYGQGLAIKIHNELIRFLDANQKDTELGPFIQSYLELLGTGPDLLFVLANEASVISNTALHIQLNDSDEVENPPSLLFITPPSDPATTSIAVFISHFLHEFTHHVDIKLLEKYEEINLNLPVDQRDALFIKYFNLKSNRFDPGFDEFFRESRAFFMELEVRDFFWRKPTPGTRKLSDKEALMKFDQLHDSLIELLSVRSAGYPDANRFRVRNKISKEEIFATGLNFGEAMRTFINRHQSPPNKTLTKP